MSDLAVAPASDAATLFARRPAWLTGTIALGSAGIVAAAVEVGGTDEGVSLCTVRHLTGGYCPGCGATRAARHLLHGEVGQAWRDHPWVLLAAAQLVTLAVLAGLLVASGRRVVIGRSWLRAIALGNVAALVAIWVVRIGVGAIPTPF